MSHRDNSLVRKPSGKQHVHVYFTTKTSKFVTYYEWIKTMNFLTPHTINVLDIDMPTFMLNSLY